MGLFNNILEKLGLRKPEAESSKGASGQASPFAEPKTGLGGGKTPTGAAPAARPGFGKPAMSEVDVVKKLEGLSAGKDLNWKVSIVDLLKLLDIDSSREARNELAKELGCPEDLMHDSAKMNVWLHKTVLKKIAENGGNIPASLLD